MLRTSTVTPPFTQLEEMQLPHCAADHSDAAWNYSICSDAHLESGENFVQRYKSATKMRYGLSLCRAQYTEEPRFKEGESSRCTSSPPNFSFSSPVKCCNSPASYKHIFHQYGLLSKRNPPAYSVARWKDMLIYLKLQGVTCQSWGGAPFLLHKVGDDQKIYTKF